MSLYITVETSDASLVLHWSVTNIGHPETGDHPDDDDLRRYRVSSPDGEFFLNHRRGDGALVLALLAMLGPPTDFDELEAKYAHLRKPEAKP